SGEVKLPTAYVEGACDAAAVMQMVSLIESGTPRPSDGTWYWRPYPGAQEEVFARMQHLFSAMAAIIKDPSYFSNDPNYVSDTESHRRELIAFALDELKGSRQRSQTSQAEEYLLGMEVVRQQWRNLSGQA
ncbi:MAG: hypothetical protein KGJ07_04470, partial [Patescibacteria group bacterium]|nr:hypothetical protein [Patescibacteria group bacterium]